MRILKQSGLIVVLWIAFMLVISSCRTSRDISVSGLKPMSADKVLDNARENAFNFDQLTIRRINVQFSNEDSRTSFRASIKAIRDEGILASISKLNIPVGRVLFTPDEVIYVNYIEKNYFQGDYTFLSKMINLDLNFNLLQALVANPLNSEITKSTLNPKKLDSSIENGQYVLKLVQDPIRQYAGSKGFLFKKNRKNNHTEEQELIVQQLFFNPLNFVLEKMVINDANEDRNVEILFSDFQKIDNYNYPGTIDIIFVTEQDYTELNLKLRGFSTEKTGLLNIIIPERYQRIHGN